MLWWTLLSKFRCYLGGTTRKTVPAQQLLNFLGSGTSAYISLLLSETKTFGRRLRLSGMYSKKNGKSPIYKKIANFAFPRKSVFSHVKSRETDFLQILFFAFFMQICSFWCMLSGINLEISFKFDH